MSTTFEKATILIVDDHPVYLDGITYILQAIFQDAHVIRAQTANEALVLATECIDLDWIFLDYQLPDSDGIKVLQQFNENMITAPVILMSGLDDVALVAEAIELGASGFIHKACSKATYEDCLNAIEKGATYLSPELKSSLEHYRRTALVTKNRILGQLSDRRLDVLVLISEGYSNSEVATALNISEATIKAHVSALMSIFDADNRSHCVAEARKLRILK